MATLLDYVNDPSAELLVTELHRIDIVGIGDDGLAGLAPHAAHVLRSAQTLVGPANLLSLCRDHVAERIETGPDPNSVVAALESRPDRKCVVLTGGDPLFYGVARYLCDRFGKDRCNVIPHVSAMQMAFARVKESWEEAYLANLDSVSLERALSRIRESEKAGLFTTEQVTPAVIAAKCLERGLNYYLAYVAENLGSPDERVTAGELSQIANLSFSPLNVMILIRKPGVPDLLDSQARQRLIGNPDDCFQQVVPKRRLLTPMEVRVLALALLDLRPESVIWDVGAGSGSVSIEASRLAQRGQVYAIEMDATEHALLCENAQRMGASNVIPILGRAPDVFASLPDPDGIFIGGTGQAVADLAAVGWKRLRTPGQLVLHVNSLHNVLESEQVLRRLNALPNIRMLQISHAIEQMQTLRFESRSPTFLIHAAR